MITRILAALVALYIVAGPPSQGSLPAVSADSGMARQALDFCLGNRETCAALAASALDRATATRATGTVAPAPPVPALAQPLPAPELPLPPKRRSASRHGA